MGKKLDEKSDIYDAISIQRRMLQVTGIWPQRNRSVFYRFRQCATWFTDCLFCSLLCLEVHANIRDGQYRHLTELLSFMASEVPYVFKHFFFWWNSERFIETVENLKRTHFVNYPMYSDRHIRSSIKYARMLMRWYQMLVASLVLMYLLKPFFTNDKMAIRFDVIDFGHFRILFHLYEVYSVGTACWNNSSLDILALGLISIGTAQFSILRDKLLNIREWAGLSYEEVDAGKRRSDTTDSDTDWHVNERLKECVKHHLNIIQYCAEIEKIYCYYFLVQFFDSVLAICNTWFQFQLAEDLLNVIFLIFYTASLLTQLGIYCLYGNNLMLKSEEIKDACYMSQWYNCDNTARKTLMIIMERSKRPTVLTAGKFSILGLAAYSNLLQSSYSYFALMNRLYGQ
ncbi:PREDICTED: odorant receptor 46a-like [Nicrophorus vespilloides]|uniref:Odorant receptor n=1 Tax=Nicrophorus vespilloides TaxID=110193 RepID=A0ABM1M1X4_NICVS|nr:PREDICTED: odorant receptor 46a-like [Nicrophorus vespilloides]